jgi:phosphate transport system protein
MDTHRQYAVINSLRDRLLFLAGEAEQAFIAATTALANKELELAKMVLAHDDAIDQIEPYIDDEGIRILTLSAPASDELKFALAAIKIAPILERIADNSSSIAEIAIALGDQPQSIVAELSSIPNAVSLMLSSAVQACVLNDSNAIREVTRTRVEIRSLSNQALHHLFELVTLEPTNAMFHTSQLKVTKHLEHIVEYIVDMCEITGHRMRSTE